MGALLGATWGFAAPRLRLLEGRAYWRPGGTGPLRPVPAELVLATGDVVEVEPSARAILEGAGPEPRELAAPGVYRLGASGPEREDRGGWSALDGDPRPPGPTDLDPEAPVARELFATVRPVGGPAWVRAGPTAPWVETRGLASLTPGSEVRADAHARAEVAAREDYVARLGPGAHLVVGPRSVQVLEGLAAAEASRSGVDFVLETAEATVTGSHGLIAAEHHPQGSTIYGHRGLWRVENRAAHPGEEASLYLAPGKHTALASPRDRPAPPRRFDADSELVALLDNFDQDRPPPPAPLPEGPEDEAARRQLRQDQEQPPLAPPPETSRERASRPPSPEGGKNPPPGRPSLEARERQQWLRLRVLSGRSPGLRRHYLRFRRHFADNRQHALPPGEEDRPVGHTEGASKRDRAEQEAWKLARHAQNLRRTEVKHHQEDLQNADMRDLERERYQRERRETFFGYEPLKFQTRALIPPTRERVSAVTGQAVAIENQIRALSGTPGFEQQLADLALQRDALLREADRRKDQLEELIELH